MVVCNKFFLCMGGGWYHCAHMPDATAGITGRQLLNLSPTDIRCTLQVTALQDRKELYAAILRLKEGVGDPSPQYGMTYTYQPLNRSQEMPSGHLIMNMGMQSPSSPKANIVLASRTTYLAMRTETNDVSFRLVDTMKFGRIRVTRLSCVYRSPRSYNRTPAHLLSYIWPRTSNNYFISRV